MIELGIHISSYR